MAKKKKKNSILHASLIWSLNRERDAHMHGEHEAPSCLPTEPDSGEVGAT